jgi:hypothetical protein
VRIVKDYKRTSEKIKGTATSPEFKRNEIHVQPFDLPEIELLQEKPQEEDLSVEAEPEEEQILPSKSLKKLTSGATNPRTG